MGFRILKRSLRRSPLRCHRDSLRSFFADRSSMRELDVAFIIGSERSGTTMLGDVLKYHRHIHCTVERDPVFSYTYTIAMQIARVRRDPRPVRDRLQRYYWQNWLTDVPDCESWRCKCQDTHPLHNGNARKNCYDDKEIRIFIDKSHPLVLFPDLICEIFPRARFIWIYRDGRDALTSMIRHYGVNVTMNYGRRVLVRDNLPNPWAGVNDWEEAQRWNDLSIAAKCTKRWASWTRAGHDWHRQNPQRVYAVRYEDMVSDPEAAMQGIRQYLGLANCPALNEAARRIFDSSVGRWPKRLVRDELADFREHGADVQKLLGYDV